MTAVYTSECGCFMPHACPFDIPSILCRRAHRPADFAWHARPVCLMPARKRGTAPTVDSLEDDIRRPEPGAMVRIASDGTVEYLPTRGTP